VANATTTTTHFAMSARDAVLLKAAAAVVVVVVVEVIPLQAVLDITLPAVALEGKAPGPSQVYRRRTIITAAVAAAMAAHRYEYFSAQGFLL